MSDAAKAFDELAYAWMKFGSEIEQVSASALDSLEARIRRQTETNCSWGAHAVGPRVLTLLDDERLRRKFADENTAAVRARETGETET